MLSLSSTRVSARPRTAPHRVHATLGSRVLTRSTREDQQAASSSVTEPSASSASASTMDGTPSSPARKLRTAEGKKYKAETTDGIASFMSRRFGLAGGLAWVGFLTVGTLGEQIKTRIEVASEEEGTKDVADANEVVLPSGVTYTDLRVGGGQKPIKGYLVVLDYVGYANGVEFESTVARKKPIVYLYGSRPFTGGMNPGVEEALSTMKAGGRRRVVVPASAGFGERGAMLRPTEHVPEKQGVVPPGATLEYDLTLVRVSIPPS